MTESVAVEASSLKRTAVGSVFLSWCLVVRDCGRSPEMLQKFEDTLKSLRARSPQAEIVVVETVSRPIDGGRTLEMARRYADVVEVYRGPRGDWNDEMLAVDDMAAARQRSFEIASGRWRAWVDSDDRIVGGEEAERLLKMNGRWKPPVRQGGVIEEGEEPSSIEDFLRALEKDYPQVTMVWAPYLYQKDAHGHALQWLERERFARWDDPKRFLWAEAAHEVLVPRGGYLPPRCDLAHLLWVHEKDWTLEDFDYSLKRHSAIMLKQYEAGDITFRRVNYLAGFCTYPVLNLGHREREFREKALEIAFTWLDRYRALIGLAGYYSRRGLTWDARDTFAAAQALCSRLPDAWYASAQCAAEREDWTTAVEHLRKGIKCPLTTESEVLPRAHIVTKPSELAVYLQRVAEGYSEAGDAATAVALLQEARDLAYDVLGKPEVGDDKIEANRLFCRAENALNSERTIFMLHQAWMHLRRNDESQKALGIAALVPWDKHHHPLVLEMEKWATTIRRHLTDLDAYARFYNDQVETGWTPLVEELATYAKAHARTRWIIDRIKEIAGPLGRPVRVLDVGCCDGIVGLPLLKEMRKAKLPVAYHGVDVFRKALDHFARLLGREDGFQALGSQEWSDPEGGLSARLEAGTLPEKGETYDVMILGEIIEHVPEPARWLSTLRVRHLSADGVILLTTPWGSFDDGHPPEKTQFGDPRDERGHVRAYSAQAFDRDVRAGGCRPLEIKRIAVDLGGDALCATLKHKPLSGPGRSIAVAVQGALWKWNGSTVDREGIGMSEKNLIRTAEKVVAEDGREYAIYGPVPGEEVHRGVGYWPRPAIRRAPRDSKILVSRAPSYIKQVDAWIGEERDAILVLQDVGYADLTNEQAKRYEHIVVVSEWHKQFTIEAHGLDDAQARKVVVIPNWVDRAQFEAGIRAGWVGLKQPHHFVYGSSPDRGLVKLLELWPRVLEMYPDATLAVFYGWRGAQKLDASYAGSGDSSWTRRYLEHRRRYERLLHQKGVTEHGMVDHVRIALELQKASVLAYPGTFHETQGAIAVEAGAAGCVPVVSDLAGLKESAGFTYAQRIPVEDAWPDAIQPPGYDDAWLEGVRRAVELTVEQRQVMASAALDLYSWEAVRERWLKVLS